MLKQKYLNRWLWRWHIIAGLITLPIILILCITGIIYLFNVHYNTAVYNDILMVVEPSNNNIDSRHHYQAQLNTVKAQTEHHIKQIYLPKTSEHATGFRLHGKGHSRDVIYVNPYTGEITGLINQKDTLMYTVRKLHGELLLSTPGTLVIELVASWFIILIITGLYVWWPAKGFSLAGLFTIRFHASRKIFWRDMHAVLGFWLSLFMLIMLAGGMPWTDVFGKQLKWVQEKTNTGYPQQWRSSKGLASFISEDINPVKPLVLDDVIDIAKVNQLQGAITVKMPMLAEGVYTVSNRAFWLSDQQVLHIDQYSGDILLRYDWSDVGILMELRQIAMRFHQGEYGLVNWWAVLFITLLFTISTIGGLLSYFIRKPKGRWGLPTVPESFQTSKWLLAFIAFLAFLFPLFGVSLILIGLYSLLSKKIKKNRSLS